jgi:predicted transposase YbfD/YdcC
MSKSLIDYLKEVPDPRQAKGSRHELWQILLITIMAIMSGSLGYQAIGRFVERHRRSLIKQLSIKQGTVPSYSTIRRAMVNVDFNKLNESFNLWAQEQAIPAGRAIAGDGKSLRNTVSDYDNSEQNFINMVSLFSHEQGTVIATAIMENKKDSEINVIQELIKQLKLEDHLLTLDALHCQKKTVVAIVESNNDYVIKVKKNQPKLFQAIETETKQSEPIQVSEKVDESKGRQAHRKVEVFRPPAKIDRDWQKVESVIKVTRSGTREGKEYSGVSYYISSLPPNSSRISKLIQGHWEIENRLHWVKDVILNEDKSTQTAGNSAINFAVLKSWVVSVFRGHGFQSIKGAIDQFAHNLTGMVSLLV